MGNLKITRLLNLTLFVFICSFIFGQLTRLPIASLPGAIFLNDILLFVLIFLWLGLTILKGKVVLPPASQPAMIFVLIAIVSIINSLRYFEITQLLTGLLLLLRYVGYFLLYLIIANIVDKKNKYFWLNLMIISTMAVAFLGFAQLLVVPDLTFLATYGWDPHQNRLTSTFFDPNFVGAFLVAGLVLAQSLYFQSRKLWLQLSSLLLLVAVILTFSRSSYLMLAIALVLFAVLKSKKIIGAFLLIVLTATLLVPKVQTRIIGAIQIDTTARARIVSWQNAYSIFNDNPLLGIGFNNYRAIQAKYGLFEVSAPLGGHSGSGSDSSVLTVAATTGIFGLLFYILMYTRLVVANFIKRDDPVALASFITLVSLAFHGQFVNSLFYPAIMAWVWIINGLIFSNGKK